MLMKLFVNVFERAKSKLTVTRSNDSSQSDSNIKISNIDSTFNRQNLSSGRLITQQQQQQPRLSLSKWLCTTPTTTNRLIPSSKPAKVRRTSSWRSLKDGTSNSVASRTFSVDQLHRNHKQSHNSQKQQDLSSSSIINTIDCCQKSSHDTTNHTRFNRLSSTFINYSKKKKNLQNRNHQTLFEQQMCSTMSHYSTGGDSGYSEESFAARSCKRSLHTSCQVCHCEQRSSFKAYKKLRNNSTTQSSPSDIINKNEQQKSSHIEYHNGENLFASQSYSHIKSITTSNLQAKQKVTRTLRDKRRRNLSCDSSLWMRSQTQKPTALALSPTFSQPYHLSLQRHFTTMDAKYFYPLKTSEKSNANAFGELNLAAIERDSLRTSFSSSSYSSSSSSSSISKTNETSNRKRTYLVWHEYKNSSILSTRNGAKIFSVTRGDQVRLLKRVGKSTLLVQKEEDDSIGFLPQSCLAFDQINSFLSLKGLKETVL